MLESLGFEVILPKQKLCCGRPLYDYGMLDTAKRYLERILGALQVELELGMPIIVLEPSCASVFRDELPNLMPEREAGKRLSAQTFLLSEFLMKHAAERLPRLERSAIVQGHCHHKTVLGFDSQTAAYEAMGLKVTQPASGCCGLAGSFGFEADKDQISSACGERVILPEVRRAQDGVLILADGFSCRTQIQQGTGRRALHLAEVIRLALQPNLLAKLDRRPEQTLVRKRALSIRHSMRRASVGMAAAALALFG